MSAPAKCYALPRSFVCCLALAVTYCAIVVSCSIGVQCPSATSGVIARDVTDRRRQNPNEEIVIVTDNPFAMQGMPEPRRLELESSVRMNLESPYVSELHMLNQAKNESFYPSSKLKVYSLRRRSTFLDAVRYANAVLPKGTLFVVANADIVFAHESVRLLTRLHNSDSVVALARHNVNSDGSAAPHEDPYLSQDAWFMRTPFPEHPGMAFPLGSLGSDNKVAYLFEQLKLPTLNWPYDVIIWHFHASNHRGSKPRLPLPYAYVPCTRVDFSALNYAWQVTTLKVGPGTTIPVISTDLPRMAIEPMYKSDVRIRNVEPEWTHRTVKAALDVAAAAAASTNNSSFAVSKAHFVDLPWSVMVANKQAPFSNAILLDEIKQALPSVSFDALFALIPEAVAPNVCKGRAKAWARVAFGVHDTAGNFLSLLVCPEEGVGEV